MDTQKTHESSYAGIANIAESTKLETAGIPSIDKSGVENQSINKEEIGIMPLDKLVIEQSTSIEQPYDKGNKDSVEYSPFANDVSSSQKDYFEIPMNTKFLAQKYSANASLIKKLSDEKVFAKLHFWAKHDKTDQLINVLDLIDPKYEKNPRSRKQTVEDKIWSIELELESSNGSIKRLQDSYLKIKRVEIDNMLLLDNKFMDGILKEYEKIFSEFGDLRQYNILNVHQDISGFSAVKLQGNLETLYIFSGKSGFLAVSSNIPNNFKYVSPKTEKTPIMNFLKENDYIRTDKKFAEKALVKIENEIIQRHSLSKIKQMESSDKSVLQSILADEDVSRFDRLRLINKYFISDVSPNTDWNRVKDVLSDREDFARSAVNTKFMFVESTGKSSLVTELLEEMTPKNAYELFESNPSEFGKYYAKLFAVDRSIVELELKIKNPEGFFIPAKAKEIMDTKQWRYGG